MTLTSVNLLTIVSNNDSAAVYSNFAYDLPNYIDKNIILILSFFLVPIIILFILLPSFRYNHWPAVFVLLLCGGTGYIISSSLCFTTWLYGQVDINTVLGPRYSPMNGTIGFWAGLDKINLTFETKDMYLNEEIDISIREHIHGLHRKFLKEGRIWPFVTVSEYLCGEGKRHGHHLGYCLMNAGRYAKVLLITSLALWVFVCYSFIYFPAFAHNPLLVIGILCETAAVMYAYIAYNECPSRIIIDSKLLVLNFGYPWYTISALGIVLTLCYTVLFLHNETRKKNIIVSHGIEGMEGIENTELDDVDSYYVSFYGSHSMQTGPRVRPVAPNVSPNQTTLTYNHFTLKDSSRISTHRIRPVPRDISEFQLRQRTPPNANRHEDRRFSATFTTFSPVPQDQTFECSNPEDQVGGANTDNVKISIENDDVLNRIAKDSDVV